MARQLQRQFTHPPMERLIQLLNAAGEPWKDGSGLKSLVKKVKQECQVCKKYRKAPPWPLVGLIMATNSGKVSQ